MYIILSCKTIGTAKAAVCRFSIGKFFRKISQNLHENIFTCLLLINVQVNNLHVYKGFPEHFQVNTSGYEAQIQARKYLFRFNNKNVDLVVWCCSFLFIVTYGQSKLIKGQIAWKKLVHFQVVPKMKAVPLLGFVK